MKTTIILGVLVLGFVLLGASAAWTALFPTTSTWTNEKAQRSAEVKDRLATLGMLINNPKRLRPGQDAATLKAEFERLDAENSQLNSEFESAHFRPKSASRYLKWTGISLTVIGIIGWYAAKQAE